MQTPTPSSLPPLPPRLRRMASPVTGCVDACPTKSIFPCICATYFQFSTRGSTPTARSFPPTKLLPRPPHRRVHCDRASRGRALGGRSAPLVLRRPSARRCPRSASSFVRSPALSQKPSRSPPAPKVCSPEAARIGNGLSKRNGRWQHLQGRRVAQ